MLFLGFWILKYPHTFTQKIWNWLKLFFLGEPVSSIFITFAGVALTSKLRFLNLHHLEGSTKRSLISLRLLITQRMNCFRVLTLTWKSKFIIERNNLPQVSHIICQIKMRSRLCEDSNFQLYFTKFLLEKVGRSFLDICFVFLYPLCRKPLIRNKNN